MLRAPAGGSSGFADRAADVGILNLPKASTSWCEPNKIMVGYEQSKVFAGRRWGASGEMDQSSAGGLQSFRFSTEAYRARERASAWCEVFGRTVVGININPVDPEGFHAEAAASRWPGFGVIYASTSAAHQANSRELIVNDDISFGVMSAPAGSWRASQLGRTVDLQSGDGVLLSNGDVGSITLPDDCRFTTFCLPRSALSPLVPDIGVLFAGRVPAANPALRMLVSYLELARNGQVLATSELKGAFTHHVADLLALSLGATCDAAELARMRGVRAARLHAIKGDIHKNLHRQQLSVLWIAARHNVTARYVQKLFEESGSTFTHFVTEQRLAAAHRLMADGARSNLSVTTIAYDCGFTDLSNFNKAFRRRFGCTPTDVRMTAGALGDSRP
jgi:AraC-like DNA-binding protein